MEEKSHHAAPLAHRHPDRAFLELKSVEGKRSCQIVNKHAVWEERETSFYLVSIRKRLERFLKPFSGCEPLPRSFTPQRFGGRVV